MAAFRKDLKPRLLSLKALSSRQMAMRVTAIFAVTFAVTVLVLGRTNSSFVGSVRSTVNDVVTPVLSVVAAPVDAMRNAGFWLSEMAGLRSENIQLKAEVTQLRQWQARASELSTENEALRSLIRVAPSSNASYIAARIVSENGGPFLRSALINGGASDGIKANQAVIGADGLIGRVVEAGKSSARVLLLTDINSHIPVIGEQSRERAIAAGNNESQLTLDYIPTGSTLEVGERMLTSGDGGVFPPGIPVGVVTEVKGGAVTLQPFVDWARLEYVSVVDYEF